MVYPVTGPYQTSVGGTGDDNALTLTYYSAAVGYKQAKPFTLPLNYERNVGTVLLAKSHTTTTGKGPRWAAAGDLWLQRVPSSLQVSLANSAYAKFRSKVSDRAELGVSFAEMNDAVSMVSRRAIQLAGFTRRILSRDFKGAAKALNLRNPPKKVVGNPRITLSQAWLEYWLGWAPAVGDIYSAIDVLQSDVPNKRVTAVVYSGPQSTVITESQGSNPSAVYPNLSYWDLQERHDWQAWLRYSAEVRVTNPNLWLANSLGLVNPLTVALELVPFSFVAEWFWNLGQVVASATDWVGLELTNSFVTRGMKGMSRYKDKTKWKVLNYGYWPPLLQEVQRTDIVMLANHVYTRRIVGPIPGPTFALRPMKLWSWERAATATSLLNVLLGRVK
jgi:hypothetical protein